MTGTILLTGATGNVGRPLARMLTDAGVPFRASVRDLERGRAALGPEALPMADVAREISSATDQSVRYRDIRPADARERLSAKLSAPFADFLVGFYGAVREGAHDVVTGDVVRVTGSPQHPFGAFVRENAPAFADGA